MIVTFKAHCGSIIDLNRDGEFQGYEFLGPPLEFRFLRARLPITDWAPSEVGYVSLLRPVIIDHKLRTHGLDAIQLGIETRGMIGTFTVLVWIRE